MLDRSVVDADLRELYGRALPWGDLDGATVLVTGATGLVGSYLVEVLAGRRRLLGAAGSRLVLVVRSERRARERFSGLLAPDTVIVEHGLDRPLTLELAADLVVHAGAPARPTDFVAAPVAAYVPNVLGTHHLLDWSSRHGVRRFCFVSSGSAQGPIPGAALAFDEGEYAPLDPLDPYACYAESKRMGETACAAWYRQSGFESVVARLGHTYGPGLSRADTRSFAEFVFDAVDGRDIVLRTDGGVRRPFCYLADATLGLLTALLRGEAATAYLVANDEAVLTILQLAELVASLAEPPVSVRREGRSIAAVHPPGSENAAVPDTSRLRSLGWSPRVGPEEGFGRTVAAHRRDRR